MATTRLYFTASVEEQWHALAGPWLRELSSAAWKSPKPTVILTPSRAEGFYLRSRLVEEKMSFLGLRFWTPSDARKFLLGELLPEMNAASQAELRLVARACAAKLAMNRETDLEALKSVIREPRAFLRAYDLLLGAGWDPAHDGAVYGRELAREMQRVLEKNLIATQAGLHRQMWSRASSQNQALFAHLLVIGFNATHWPLWDLLKAIVFSSVDAVVALSEPRVFAEEVDQLWISSWEEVTQTEAVSSDIPLSPPHPHEIAAPFTKIVAAYEKGEQVAGSEADLTFLVTPDLATQTRAVVLQTLDYLKRDSCTRLGIVFPEANALALGIAEELRQLGIPIDDGTGSLAPGHFEKRCWQTWIAVQEEQGVQSLIAWVRACEKQGVSCGWSDSLPVRHLADCLESALAETLIDNLDFLASYLEEKAGHHSNLAGRFLKQRVTLPEEATFARFLELTRQALALPGWEDYLARLETDPPVWLQKNNVPLSRRTFLEWLKESTDSLIRTRGADGNHFYGKVHLLIYGQMTGQTWSHLILTGMNEGVWPRFYETGAFGSRHELAELNRHAHRLNIAGQNQGGQGEGHQVVMGDHGYCLLPLERHALALRDLCSALDSTSISACLTATTREGGRSLLPNDFFNHAYQQQTGHALDEKAFRRLAIFTQEWCRKNDVLINAISRAQIDETPDAAIHATRIAYEARRNPDQPFGPHEFSYDRTPSRPIQLTCKQWESAWNYPAATWLTEVVGVAPWPEGELSWSNAIGMWVHRWMATALNEWPKKPRSAEELPVLVWSAADREAAALRSRAQASGFPLYPWWGQVWNRARTLALQLSESLAPLLPGRAFLSEFTLPPNLMVALPESTERDFLLRGRIDFLLLGEGMLPEAFTSANFTGASAWIIDFKTGAARKLTSTSILNGTGLQAILYALAVRTLGAEKISVSLLAPESEAKSQIELNATIDPMLASLDRLHRNGIFGMRSNANSEYGFAPSYPIATQAIPNYILDAKWSLTHGIGIAEDDE